MKNTATEFDEDLDQSMTLASIVNAGVPDPELRFTGLPPQTENLDGIRFRLNREMSYRMKDGCTITIRVPFVFDWASVPWIFTLIYPPAGDGKNLYGWASVFHDWLLEHKKIEGEPISREQADDVFKEIMDYLNVLPLKSWLLWKAVKLNTWWKRMWGVPFEITEAAPKENAT